MKQIQSGRNEAMNRQENHGSNPAASISTIVLGGYPLLSGDCDCACAGMMGGRAPLITVVPLEPVVTAMISDVVTE